MTTGRTKSPCAFIVKARRVVLLAALSGAMPDRAYCDWDDVVELFYAKE